MTKFTYPFVPRSTAYLEPGHFWSIPLSGGGFACGRVIQMRETEEGKRDSRGFLAGLLDWCGTSPPTFDSIAGRKTIKQGSVHVKTIRENGGEVLGSRPLDLDGIEPDLFLDQAPGRWAHLQRGYVRLRPAKKDEWERYAVFSTWGYEVIKILAEKHCGRIGGEQG